MAVESRNALLAGRYRVQRPLGSGGMATVFLCEDERLGRQVAVKRLHAHSPDDVARRFSREAKLGASLNHPNLVSVFDTLTDDEAVLIVMEYVEGETLHDALQRGPLPPKRALEVIRDVAHALDHAHSHGVVHRDVKPRNILLRKDGVVKLVDLGIATAADMTRITQSGVVLGTASYMAPEQIEGQKAGPAVDVYALAAVAFEALAGRKAREGRTAMEIAHQVATEPPPDLRDAWPEAPPALADAVRRGMARDPSERPSSARELCAEIERALDRAARPKSASRRVAGRGRPVRPGRERRGMRAALPAAALLCLAAAAMIVILLSGGGGSSSKQAKTPTGGGSSDKQKQSQGNDSSPAPPAQTPGTAQPTSGGDGPSLNDQGYRLMQARRYDDAVSLLRRAVAAFPQGTTDLQYAYALYNLGRALRLAGKAGEAVPVLERRMRIPNQTDTVRRELDAARRDAAKG
jgi:eukaryotic-like serine/threonine-protein kinase